MKLRTYLSLFGLLSLTPCVGKGQDQSAYNSCLQQGHKIGTQAFKDCHDRRTENKEIVSQVKNVLDKRRILEEDMMAKSRMEKGWEKDSGGNTRGLFPLSE